MELGWWRCRSSQPMIRLMWEAKCRAVKTHISFAQDDNFFSMKRGRTSLAYVVLLLVTSCAFAQSAGSLRGHVTDPTGAVIPGANVTATNAQGQKANAVTDQQGAYEIKGLAAGSYTVTTTAKGFALSTEQNVAISAGQAQQFNIALELEVEKQKLEVQDENVTVNTNASDNASAIVIKGKDLDALPDDPDELEQDLQALAGPSAGPNGGQIYID